MKTVLIAAAASLALAATAAPVLAGDTASDAKVCASAETKAAWKDGNASPFIVQADTVAGQKAYCAGLKTAGGHYAGATASVDNRGASGDNSGATGARTADAADTDTAAGMTTTMDPNAKPGE